MSPVVNGRSTPSLDLALAIWQHTNGEVSLRSILDPHGALPWPTGLRLFDSDPEVSKEVAALRTAELKDAKTPRRVVTPGLQAAETRKFFASVVGELGPSGEIVTIDQARAAMAKSRATGADPIQCLIDLDPGAPTRPASAGRRPRRNEPVRSSA